MYMHACLSHNPSFSRSHFPPSLSSLLYQKKICDVSAVNGLELANASFPVPVGTGYTSIQINIEQLANVNIMTKIFSSHYVKEKNCNMLMRSDELHTFSIA